MSVPEVSYQIPSNEWTDQPVEREAVKSTQNFDKSSWGNNTDLTIGSAYYEQRAGLLAEEIANRNLRQEIVALGDSIFQLRQTEIERFLGGRR